MSLGYSPQWGRVIKVAEGYRAVYCPDHPNAWKSGYVYVHRIVMEAKLGRLLRADEIVHHKNEVKSDNSPENLEVTSRPEHADHHRREAQVYRFNCGECGKPGEKPWHQRPEIKGQELAFCNRSCSGKHSRREQLAKRS